MNMGGMDMGGGASACSSSMLWNWQTVDSCIFAASWHVTTRGAFAASCIGVALLALALEFCRRIGREYDQLIARQFQAVAQRRSRAGGYSWAREHATNTTRQVASAARPTSYKSTSSKALDGDETSQTDMVPQLAGTKKASCCATKKACPPDEVAGPSQEGAVVGAKGDATFGADAEIQRTPPRVLKFRVSAVQQLIRAVAHAVTFGLAYILMLIAMSFNGYIIICIIIGAGLGKFLCDWMVVQVFLDDNDSAIHDTLPPTCDDPTVSCG
ncbi:unnamed protein product [Parajaminaea phylloscopi]